MAPGREGPLELSGLTGIFPSAVKPVMSVTGNCSYHGLPEAREPSAHGLQK